MPKVPKGPKCPICHKVCVPSAIPVSELVPTLEPAAAAAAAGSCCDCAERAFCLENLAVWAGKAWAYTNGHCQESAQVEGRLEALNRVIQKEAARTRRPPVRIAYWDQLNGWAALVDDALTLGAFMAGMPFEYSLERVHMRSDEPRFRWFEDPEAWSRKRGPPGTLAEVVADARRVAALADAAKLCNSANVYGTARLAAEEVILGLVLEDSSKLADVGLTPEDFSEPMHQAVFAAMLERQQPIDAASLAACSLPNVGQACPGLPELTLDGLIRNWREAARRAAEQHPEKPLADLLQAAVKRLRQWAEWCAEVEKKGLKQARELVARAASEGPP